MTPTDQCRLSPKRKIGQVGMYETQLVAVVREDVK
jgi:hypothetical protein